MEGDMRVFAALVCSALVPGAALAGGSFPAHRGDSPWSFTIVAEPSDTFVVNDTDSGTIDTFLFRSEGPIVIEVPIHRYVGRTDADGHLLDGDDLVKRGIVSEKATLRLPAFDVDEKTFPVFDCDGDGVDDQLMNEVDEIFLNDEKLGTLKGDNGIWTSQNLTVPISKLKFPSSPGATAINRFRVDIDTANKDVVLSSGAVGCEVWGVAIDWVGIKFKASSPVALVHGIRSSGAVWGDVKAGLADDKVESDNTITLADPPAPDPAPVGCGAEPYNDTIQNNVAQLQAFIPAIAERYGTSSLHFGTHSKGGLDSLGFISGLAASPIPGTGGAIGGEPHPGDGRHQGRAAGEARPRGALHRHARHAARRLGAGQVWRRGAPAHRAAVVARRAQRCCRQGLRGRLLLRSDARARLGLRRLASAHFRDAGRLGGRGRGHQRKRADRLGGGGGLSPPLGGEPALPVDRDRRRRDHHRGAAHAAARPDHRGRGAQRRLPTQRRDRAPGQARAPPDL